MASRIRQTVTFKAGSHQVYEALMDSRKHSRFTGGKASISRKTGGRFSAFDGYAEGVNLELVPDKKIVQTWRAGDWPPKHYSTITISLADVKNGCRLTFTQTGVPDSYIDDIAQGWKDYYWTQLKAMLEK